MEILSEDDTSEGISKITFSASNHERMAQIAKKILEESERWLRFLSGRYGINREEGQELMQNALILTLQKLEREYDSRDPEKYGVIFRGNLKTVAIDFTRKHRLSRSGLKLTQHYWYLRHSGLAHEEALTEIGITEERFLQLTTQRRTIYLDENHDDNTGEDGRAPRTAKGSLALEISTSAHQEDDIAAAEGQEYGTAFDLLYLFIERSEYELGFIMLMQLGYGLTMKQIGEIIRLTESSICLITKGKIAPKLQRLMVSEEVKDILGYTTTEKVHLQGKMHAKVRGRSQALSESELLGLGRIVLRKAEASNPAHLSQTGAAKREAVINYLSAHIRGIST